ncbi:hypothetical protein AFEL58S_03509 [Afipia felis]
MSPGSPLIPESRPMSKNKNAFSLARRHQHLPSRMIFILMIATLTLFIQGCSAERSSDRRKRSFYFAASDRNAAVLVRTKQDNVGILLMDFQTQSLRKLGIKGSHLLSPSLSLDGKRLLFARQPYDETGHELISCETDTLKCRVLVKTSGSIVSPVEISNGRVLYASSPYIPERKKYKYSKADLWILDQSGPRKLTNIELFQITAISASKDFIYFSGEAAPGNPALRPADPVAGVQSDIFRLPFDVTGGRLLEPVPPLAPLFVEAGRSTQSSVSANGDVVAFLRSAERRVYFRYDLVIADMRKNRNQAIEATEIGFSRPIVVDDGVIVSSIRSDRLAIKKFAFDASDMTPLIEIEDASVDKMDEIELLVTD